MREITTHKSNDPLNNAINIEACDALTLGGAPVSYQVSITSDKPNFNRLDTYQIPANGSYISLMVIPFQNGPVKEVGANGVSIEALLAILADRLSAFQAGPYACDENAQALKHIEAALNVLYQRTKSRMERGVEGTSVK